MKSPKSPGHWITLTLGLLLTACNQTTHVEQAEEQVVVHGTGLIKATPDRFHSRAVPNARGDDVALLREQVDARVERILAITADLDIPASHVDARALHLSPEWSHGPERQLRGYVARRPVHITVNDTTTLARLMRALTAAGITEVHASGASFSQRQALERRALAQAVSDATARAETLAGAAGRRLGPALHIAEMGGGGATPMRLAMESGTGQGYQAGEQDIKQRVEVRFALQ